MNMLVVENGTILRGPELAPQRMNLVIEDGIIKEITDETVTSGDRIDASDLIVCPALVNSHVHIGDSVALDVGDGMPLEDIVRPPHGLKHRILESSSPGVLVESMRRTARDMITHGTGSFIDYREGGTGGVELLREALADLPISGIVLGRDPVVFDEGASPAEIRRRVRRVLRVSDGFAPSGMGEITDEAASIIVEECERAGKIASIHVAEHIESQRRSIEDTGMSEVERAINAGFKLLVHLTNPVRGDLELVRESGASVVLCPRSNGALSSGIPPIRRLHEMGINLLLGTDNLMFNSPDMLREMEYTLKVTRGCTRSYFPPREVLRMATSNTSDFTGTGVIEEGFPADLILVEKMSEDPCLSIINRTESKNIIYLIIKGKPVKR
ncbi:MAG: amidohydrolase family protein [Methanothermobacter sp.]|nr:amidohydrolase family protein [Methanothermobacter sp.]